jgi:dienelactone hydrolase
MTSYGAYDMAGNVREWCYNESQIGRIIRGGAWNDNTYEFRYMNHAYPFNRSPKNGFRCVLIPEPEKIPDLAFAIINIGEEIDFHKKKPVSDEIFKVYKEQFFYDKIPLQEQVESRDENAEDWIQEQVTFDAAYGGERIIAMLFIPKNVKPPYQTVIYFPGEQALFRNSSKDIEGDLEFKVFLSFIVKNGRAVLYPVYKGTMERKDIAFLITQPGTHLHTEQEIQLVKDFKRCIDYLETRYDIDSDKLAYYGMSWGAMIGTIILAVEKRLKASILLAGGFAVKGKRPEVDQINYITRVKTPTLMLNGRNDSFIPYETFIMPLYELLGTPNEHKELKLYGTDHIPPRKEFIKEILAWLDRYLGPVN